VKDAKQQALMRPGILRKAAAKHNLFLAEDGSVLEIVDDDDTNTKEVVPKEGEKKKRKRRTKAEMEADRLAEELAKKVSFRAARTDHW
jgi:hypothetical protein